jgi:tocopherol cyclase
MGQTEDLGMVSVHYDGIMYEATPWIGTMQWDVSPWGMWNMTGRSTKGERPFEVALFSTSDKPGVVLRVPSSKGMVYFCRDSFSTNTTLSLWELVWDKSLGEYVRGKTIIDEARSTQAAVEVGGGPWWDRWKGESNMKQPFKGLVRFPYRVANLRRRLMQR